MRDAAEQRNGQEAVQDNQKRRHFPPPIRSGREKWHAANFLRTSDAEVSSRSATLDAMISIWNVAAFIFSLIQFSQSNAFVSRGKHRRQRCAASRSENGPAA